MIHLVIRCVEIVAVIGTVASWCYFWLCMWGALTFLRNRGSGSPGQMPPVSILKPCKGIDPGIYESFRSHCLQDYPEYEIIFGVSDPDDPVIASVKDLQSEFPRINIRLVVCPQILGTNIKVSNLVQMLPQARYECLIVNDSDIRVAPDYLQRVVPALADQQTGMVTCLYRAIAEDSLGSILEALGVSTDFSAGVLAAGMLEEIRFGLGSTLAFRRSDLRKIGGFETIVDYLADDYELGKRIADLGQKVVLSDSVVETHLPAYDFAGYFSHQLRWSRAIRDSRKGGFLGLIFTFGLMWSVLGAIVSAGASWAGGMLAITLFLRYSQAWIVGVSILEDSQVPAQLWLLPLRDLMAFLVWIASFAGNTITWRGARFELKDGKLIRLPE